MIRTAGNSAVVAGADAPFRFQSLATFFAFTICFDVIWLRSSTFQTRVESTSPRRRLKSQCTADFVCIKLAHKPRLTRVAACPITGAYVIGENEIDCRVVDRTRYGIHDALFIEFVLSIFSMISSARWSRGADASNRPRSRSITPRFCRLSATDSESGPSIFSAI